MNTESAPAASQTISPRALEALHALRAAASLRSGITETEVMQSVVKQLQALGLQGAICMLDDEGKNLVVRAWTFPHQEMLNQLERLTGLDIVGFAFPLGRAEIYQRVVETGETVFLPNIAEVIAQLVPEAVGGLTDTILSIFSSLRSAFFVPIHARGQVVGVLDVSAPTLDEADQAMAQVFAAQVGTALENAWLLQETRDSRDAVLNMLEDLDETARQLREKAERLQSSELEYRTLVENATELIWTLNTEGHFTFVNRQAEQVSGYKLQDMLGKSFAPLIVPPEDLPRIQQVFLKTLAGKTQSYDAGVRRADGSLFYLSVNTAPLYRESQVTGTISFGRDVTAQKAAETALEQRLTELSALFQVSGARRCAAKVEEMLPIILDKTLEVLQADTGALFLQEEKTHELVAQAAQGRLETLRGLRLGPAEGVCGYVAQTRAPYTFGELASDPHNEARLQLLAHGVQAGICVPLMTGDHLVGTLITGSNTPRIFGDDEIHLLTAIADMAASAIHRATLFEQLEHRVQELSALFDVGKMVTASLRIEDVVEFVVHAVTKTLRAEGGALFLWDEREERLVMRAVVGAPSELVGQVKYRSGEGLVGWVFLERRPANVSDAAADPRWKVEPEQEGNLPSRRINGALIVPLTVGEKILGTLSAANKIGAPMFTESDEALLTTLAGQIAVAIENARLYEDVRGLSTATIRSLATAIDARDPYTRGHSEEVARLGVQVARELGWRGADLEMFEFAALLHDVGKIAVPDAILLKAAPLTPKEWSVIYLHPYHSAQIVKPVEPLRRIVPWIYHHQEKWDGTGYPDGLKGEAIPLASRIIAVADAFNAMTTDRPYRQAKRRADALAELQRCAGQQFDPHIVQVFTCLLDRAEQNK